MKHLLRVTTIVLAAFFSLAHAQVPTEPQAGAGGPADLVIKVSSNKGTFFEMTTQLVKVCSTPSMEISQGKGTVASMNEVINNQAELMLVTADTLIGRKTQERDNSVDILQVLFPMYISELHILARRADHTVNKFSDAGNKRVGTYGGANITSRILFGPAETGGTGVRPLSLMNYETEDGLLKALASNEIDVGFIGVGQPAPWAKTLDGNRYKLIEFDRQDVLGKKGFVEASLRYSNISQVAVRTLGVQVYMVTRKFESPAMIRHVSTLKKCVADNILTLRETRGNHPKWAEVRPNDPVTAWPMFKTVNVAEERKGKGKK